VVLVAKVGPAAWVVLRGPGALRPSARAMMMVRPPASWRTTVVMAMALLASQATRTASSGKAVARASEAARDVLLSCGRIEGSLSKLTMKEGLDAVISMLRSIFSSALRARLTMLSVRPSASISCNEDRRIVCWLTISASETSCDSSSAPITIRTNQPRTVRGREPAHSASTVLVKR
jgi:hypothetical protein